MDLDSWHDRTSREPSCESRRERRATRDRRNLSPPSPPTPPPRRRLHSPVRERPVAGQSRDDVAANTTYMSSRRSKRTITSGADSTSQSANAPSQGRAVTTSRRAQVTGFSSKQWDEMLEAGWCVKGSASILGGAGYVLAPWLQNETRNIRELKGRTEGKDTGFWM